jgi:hypothetical protein
MRQGQRNRKSTGAAKQWAIAYLGGLRLPCYASFPGSPGRESFWRLFKLLIEHGSTRPNSIRQQEQTPEISRSYRDLLTPQAADIHPRRHSSTTKLAVNYPSAVLWQSLVAITR